MKQQALFWIIVLLALGSLACNAFAGETVATLAPPALAAETPLPADGSAPTATLPTPDNSASVTVLVDLNVRSGPGVEYSREGFLLEGESALIIGRNADGSWWQIACPPTLKDATSCWVSAGAAYSRAENATAVAEVESPPTPTPALPDLPEGVGVLAYLDGGRLFAAELDLLNNPPLLGTVRPLTDITTVQTLLLSPDGRRVAYTAGDFPTNRLIVVNIDGSDERALVASAEIPLSPDIIDPESLSVLIDQIAWLPDGSGLLFNTYLINQFGPGAGSQEDLWSVALDGALLQRLAAGAGGGAFAFLPNGEVVLSGRDKVVRTNLESGRVETVISYPLINTASEYIYYPQPQPIGVAGLNIAIPGENPWESDASAALWQVPPTGAALRLGDVVGNLLFHTPVWSDSGGRMGYVQQIIDPANPPAQLLITAGNGTNPEPYTSDPQLQFFEWHTASDRFLFSATDYMGVGQPGNVPLRFPLIPGQQANNSRWISAETFLLAVGFPDSNRWDLASINTNNGVGSPLLSVSSGTAGIVYDLWMP